MANGFFSEEDKSCVMPYLCSQRKLDVVKILPEELCAIGKVVGMSHREASENILFLQKVKANSL